ncbi:uncharacterized protein LOC126719297 [Quercus robur]|uniref:uncharacterized protein LOC126719297 n=1 Tax=Quercus robur TaxID=38942 RepID=UPI0021617847|nr:uncharacterized protein LOC126719297 [Quercus robur]
MTPRSLKAKSKISKKPLASNSLNTDKIMLVHMFGEDKGGGRRSKYGRATKKVATMRNIVIGERNDKRQRPQKNQEKISELEKRKQKQRNKANNGGSNNSIKSQKNKEKRDGRQPDCFRYSVMGVSTSKKDLVISIKPGLKLFLFDFDLKLLYGIYKSSSSGGMKLEPRAFGGAFPVQVRFTVEKDCFPLSEAVFKKAIKEIYNEKNKFKTELTVRQVRFTFRKLTELFRPAGVLSNAHSVHSPQVARVYDQTREVHERGREVWPYSHNETLPRDPYSNGDFTSYPLLSHERDQRIAHRDVTSIPRGEIPRELYLTEREYRAYGLQGEIKNLSTPSQFTPTLEMYQKEYEREHLPRQPDYLYRDAIPAQRETLSIDPLYINEKEYQAYGLGARRELPPTVPVATVTSATALGSYANDPYYAYRYGALSGDPYLPSVRREEVPSRSYSVGGTFPGETAHLRRIETDQGADRLYSTYAADALLRYNQTENRQVAQPEAVSVPVSSRYSFAGPSFSFR